MRRAPRGFSFGHKMIAAQSLRALLDYNPETGEFTRRVNMGRWGRLKAGERVGTLCNEYLVCHLGGRQEYLHRLAYLYTTGHEPCKGFEIDHINGDTHDNRWQNLRLASKSENQQNRVRANKSIKATSNLLGVYWSNQKSKWMARITINRTEIFLGLYDDEQQAHAAYLRAKHEVHPFSPTNDNELNLRGHA